MGVVISGIPRWVPNWIYGSCLIETTIILNRNVNCSELSRNPLEIALVISKGRRNHV